MLTTVEAESELELERRRVLLVDDHPLFRDGMCRLLGTLPFLEVIASVGSAGEALEVAYLHRIDLGIVDLILPSGGGIGLTRRLKCLQPHCRILGLSVHEDPIQIAAMIRAGADGFVFKTQQPEDMIAAISCVLAAKRYLPPLVDPLIVARLAQSEEITPLDRLSNRELEVYDLLVAGLTNECIATKLFIARRTVETHRHNIMKKLEVRSIADLVRLSFALRRER